MTMSTDLPRAAQVGDTSRATGFWPVLLCWVAVALDGYDLVVLGVVIPTLLENGALGFTGPTVTTASTLGLVGMGVGAVLIGPLTDRFGRRHTLITSVAIFSLFTIATGLAQGVGQFTTFRFAGRPRPWRLSADRAGVHERARHDGPRRLCHHPDDDRLPRRRRALRVVGVVARRGLRLAVDVRRRWRNWPADAPIHVGQAPRIRGVSPCGRAPRRHGTLARSAAVVKGRYLRISIGLCVASFMGLLLVYGLNTWLPTIMRDAGYSIQQGTTLILVLNVGAVLGLLVAGHIADTRGNKPAVLAWFGLAAVFLALLSIKLESRLLVYAAVLLTGIFVFSAQVLVYAFVGHLYPPEIRGTALGVAAGVGRVGAIVGPTLGGALVTAGIAYPWGFYAFTLAAILAVVTLATVPAHAPDSD